VTTVLDLQLKANSFKSEVHTGNKWGKNASVATLILRVDDLFIVKRCDSMV